MFSCFYIKDREENLETLLSPINSSEMSAIPLPALPKSASSVFGDALQHEMSAELAVLQEETIAADESRDFMFRQTRSIFQNTTQLIFALRTGKLDDLDRLINENKDTISRLLDRIRDDPLQREGRLTIAIEKFTEALLLLHFFKTGTLAPLSVVSPCNDEEYLSAALGFAQELTRYVVGRACDGDTDSIALCRVMILQLNTKMLEFDFRNGILRRKYDGLKYALKNVEDITYELSLLENHDKGKDGEEEDAMPAKKMRTADKFEELQSCKLLDEAEIDAIKQRMDAFDKMRDEVIKQSRDVQKQAKAAIFSVHRGNYVDARAKLDSSLSIAKNIMNNIIKDHPTLRQGSFSNSLEEWAEGYLTLEWVLHHRIALKSELEIVSSHEYIGALSDFTGEIGRIAIAHASKRDITRVKEILECSLTISAAMMTLNIGGKYTKKADAVAVNLKKVENVVYDLAMLQRGGKAGRERDVEPKEDDTNTGDNEM